MRERKAVDEKMIREVPDWKHDPDPTPPAIVPQWEYMTIVGARNADLNRFGAGGWELVSAIAQPADRAAYYFKRRK